MLVVILPLLGVLLHLVARGNEMQERDLPEAARREQALQEYIWKAAASAPASPAQ